MNLGKIGLLMLFLALGLSSCKKDDDDSAPVTPPRDRGEQQILDKDSLIEYLETHYYNSADFEANPDPSISDLVITKLEDGEDLPDGHTILKDSPKLSTNIITFAKTEYEFYVLKLNQGGGLDKPTFADDVRVLYEASLLDATVIDKNDVVPSYFDLITEIAVEGWRRVLPLFNTAEIFNEVEDGTVNFVNKGVGVMFLPSGLAYFSGATGNTPAYSPLIFKFELLQMFQNDHDGDGIPSYLEDINEDGGFTINVENSKDPDDDDTDGDFNPDYADIDDDGDGVLTKDEIVVTTVNKPTRQEVLDTVLEDDQVLLNKIVKEQNGSYTGTIITFTDTDGDGVPDYLDK
ncbi:MAG: FKBP-type peptidyl-prolyl cis-trans isomerase [Flavobacteriales bacterium]